MKRIFNFLKCNKKCTHIILVLSILLIISTIGTTIAFIVTKTDTSDNTFVPPIARISLEGFDDITNTGNIPVYVRTYALINWFSTEDEHTLLSKQPEAGVDFKVKMITDGWFLADDGFFYYEKPLNPGESIALYTELEQLTEMEGYEIRLLFISSSIPVDPEDALNDAWPAVQINEDGELEKRVTSQDEVTQ